LETYAKISAEMFDWVYIKSVDHLGESEYLIKQNKTKQKTPESQAGYNGSPLKSLLLLRLNLGGLWF
jgi:hypothetical protein